MSVWTVHLTFDDTHTHTHTHTHIHTHTHTHTHYGVEGEGSRQGKISMGNVPKKLQNCKADATGSSTESTTGSGPDAHGRYRTTHGQFPFEGR